jgi:hypothetical protein
VSTSGKPTSGTVPSKLERVPIAFCSGLPNLLIYDLGYYGINQFPPTVCVAALAPSTLFLHCF